MTPSQPIRMWRWETYSILLITLSSYTLYGAFCVRWTRKNGEGRACVLFGPSLALVMLFTLVTFRKLGGKELCGRYSGLPLAGGLVRPWCLSLATLMLRAFATSIPLCYRGCVEVEDIFMHDNASVYTVNSLTQRIQSPHNTLRYKLQWKARTALKTRSWWTFLIQCRTALMLWLLQKASIQSIDTILS